MTRCCAHCAKEFSHRYRGLNEFCSDACRLLSKVSVAPDGCWNWTALIDRYGYGGFSLNGRRRVAHRASYLLFVGPVPDGLDLDHLCRNRACVNPAHLEPVTRRENVRRGIRPAQLREWHANGRPKAGAPR